MLFFAFVKEATRDLLIICPKVQNDLLPFLHLRTFPDPMYFRSTLQDVVNSDISFSRLRICFKTLQSQENYSIWMPYLLLIYQRSSSTLYHVTFIFL